ncbi:DHHA1 domain-containing protein, partial [Erwinia amylovora]|uniref:DHHA1 domain-containing protein n=1 Tax=Erwinia amylovora TaxID=552 RepID=UPI00200A6BE2
GEGALALLYSQNEQLVDIAQLVKANHSNLNDKVRALIDHARALEKQLQQLKDQQAAQESASLSSKASAVNCTKLLVSELSDVEQIMLRTMVDYLKNLLGSAIIVLATVA